MTAFRKMTGSHAQVTVWRIVAGALLIGAWAFAPLHAEEVDAKGLFLSKARDGLKFNVLLDRDGRQSTVSTGHRFRSGDRMRFQFEINRDAYVYVVHRQIDGDPASEAVSRYAGLKGIRMVLGSGSSSADLPRDTVSPTDVAGSAKPLNYRLLFPSQGAGRENKLTANKVHAVPYTERRHFAMDDDPGIEKLYVIVSPAKLERLEGLFGNDGTLAEEGGADGRVTAMLAQYSGNAGVSIGKGIMVESYGVGVEPGKPFMAEVDLAHYVSQP